jgi:hypothetical protein
MKREEAQKRNMKEYETTDVFETKRIVASRY